MGHAKNINNTNGWMKRDGSLFQRWNHWSQRISVSVQWSVLFRSSNADVFIVEIMQNEQKRRFTRNRLPHQRMTSYRYSNWRLSASLAIGNAQFRRNQPRHKANAEGHDLSSIWKIHLVVELESNIVNLRPFARIGQIPNTFVDVLNPCIQLWRSVYNKSIW